ncbi:MAG: threonine synthase [Candidatus Aureabacteria bacterium]|nr:threonine synthase [Candidatus Auribacterota bacterium]
MKSWKGLIDKYKKYLPVTEKTPIVTLNEGNTPLIYSDRLSGLSKGKLKVYLKFDGANPTGSFKDRGMTMAVSKAVEEGSKAVMCASTGNTSASAAAYASRAGIACVVLIPEGAIALGKLAQALIHGAKVIAVKGNFDDALEMVKEITSKYPITLVNSLNPYRIQGQKTAAFEICDFLADAPVYHAIPVGNAGNITAYWMGYCEYFKEKKTSRKPVMLGFQAAGSAPIVRGHVIKKPETIATAIKIGNPASWKQAEAARDESGGLIGLVTDDEILEAYKMLAEEGVFCEPASAASVAGMIKKINEGYFESGVITCTLTGHGLKDPDRAIKSVKEPVSCEADVKKVIDLIF